MKNDLPKSSPGVTAVMEACHKLSHEVFKNLSHALELPWEKYLGEMHEFTVPSMDSLKTFKAREPIRNEWSTLVRSAEINPNFLSFRSANMLRSRRSLSIQHLYSQQQCCMVPRSPSSLKVPRRWSTARQLTLTCCHKDKVPRMVVGWCTTCALTMMCSIPGLLAL